MIKRKMDERLKGSVNGKAPEPIQSVFIQLDCESIKKKLKKCTNLIKSMDFRRFHAMW